MAKLIYRKQTIGGIDLDVAAQGSTLRLNEFTVANLAGARLAVRGNRSELFVAAAAARHRLQFRST